jgi:hypothetical protein
MHSQLSVVMFKSINIERKHTLYISAELSMFLQSIIKV